MEEIVDFLVEVTGFSVEEIEEFVESGDNDIHDMLMADLADQIHDYVWEGDDDRAES